MPLDMENTLLDVVKGQERTETLVKDMHSRLFGGNGEPGALLLMHQEHKKTTDDLEKRVHSVEKKVWYSTGFGAAIGAVASFIGIHLKS